MLSQPNTVRLHHGVWVIDCASRQAYNLFVIMAPWSAANPATVFHGKAALDAPIQHDALLDRPRRRLGTRLPQEDWSWLNDTYWYVTPDDLPAVATDLTTQQHEPVLDQTVWFIEGYAHGYFWGKTFVQLMGRPRLCLH